MATILHDSDCAVHNAPAMPVGPCDCGVSHIEKFRTALTEIAETHIGDCPASMDEEAFAKSHIQRLRKIARNALSQ